MCELVTDSSLEDKQCLDTGSDSKEYYNRAAITVAQEV